MFFKRLKDHQPQQHLQLEDLEQRQLLSSVDIFAAGATNQETIQLKIDDAVVQTWHNLGGNADAGDYSVLTYQSSQNLSADQIKIEFVNDAYNAETGFDRNVRVDKIVLDGVTYETESPSVFSTGTWLPSDGVQAGFRQSEYLNTNGYFQYSSGGTTIDVVFRGTTGDEKFNVEANGQVIAVWQASTEFQTYSITTSENVAPGNIRINFTNDAYDPGNNYDRNLQIDRIIVNGQSIETESDTVFSTGSWRAEDGIVSGIRNSEFLNTNGYFQFGTTASELDPFRGRYEFGVPNDIEELQDPSRGVTLRRVTTSSYPGDGSGAQWDAPEPASNPATPPNFPGNVGTAVQPLKITDNIYAPGSEDFRPNSAGLNEYSIFFSQFVTHDLVHSLRAAGPPIFYDGQFIPVSRTPAVVENGVLQQVSSETPTLDLGLVYGRDEAATELLREAVIVDGQYVLGARLISGGAGDVLPSYAEVAQMRGKPIEEVFATLGKTFLNLPPQALANQVATGDERANQTTSLTAHHTIWHRNHNWHVEQLRTQNPSWSEERLYHAARALNEAEYQKVIYDEYLPKLIGDGRLADYNGYNPETDNRIINEWTTVAFRFGHDQSSSGQILISEDGQVTFIPLEVSSLIANNGQNIDTDQQLGDWIRGQLSQSSQEIDGRIVSSLRNALFGVPANQDGNDGSSEEFLQLNLPLLDIHRGRDHGVSDYNQLRAGLGLSTYSSLDEFAAANGLDPERLGQLKSVYSDISELDSIVGGLLEAKVPGSQLGETFTLLNVMQFEATRDGDPFFYLNRFKDSPEILSQIERTSMNDILVRNGVIDSGFTDAFLAHGRIEGTEGYDVLYGNPYSDLMLGHEGNDKLFGGEGNDNLFGGFGNDMLSGQGQDDFLFGGFGSDNLYGGWGDDVIIGAQDDDWLWGGEGNDTFVFYAGSGDDVVFDFGDGDRLDFSSYGFASFEEFESRIRYQWNSIEIQAGAETVTVKFVKGLNETNVIL